MATEIKRKNAQYWLVSQGSLKEMNMVFRNDQIQGFNPCITESLSLFHSPVLFPQVGFILMQALSMRWHPTAIDLHGP